MLQASVEIVNPAGTGRPALVISANPAPLPPRVSFIVRLPSALPFPKKYTNFFGPLAFVRFVFFVFAFFFVLFCFANLALLLLFRYHLGNIGQLQDQSLEPPQQPKPR